MSVKIITLAWSVQSLNTNEKIVLLALSDIANDKGECFYNENSLATKCSIMDVHSPIKKLIENGWVRRGVVDNQLFLFEGITK